MRQYIGATVARDYYFADNGTISPKRQHIAHIAKERTELLEPQVLPTLASWGYRLARSEQLWIPRFVSASCWVAGGFFLSLIASRFIRPPGVTGALMFYLFMPFAIISSRVFMPDPMAWMLMICSQWLVVQYFENPTAARFAFVLIVTSIGMLVRPMCLLFVFPVFFLLECNRHGFMRSILRWQTWLMALAPLVPAVLFYAHGFAQGEFISQQASISFCPRLYHDPHYWIGWARMIGRVTGWVPTLAALASVIWFAPKQFRLLLIGMWTGYIFYGLIFNYNIHTHDYYSMPLVPIVALSLAPLLQVVFARLSEIWTNRRGILVAIAMLMLLCLPAVAFAGRHLPSGGPSQRQKLLLQQLGLLVGIDKKFLQFLGRDDNTFHRQVKDFCEIGALVDHSPRTILLADDYGKALIYHGELWGACWPPAAAIRQIKRTGLPLYGPIVMETPEDFEALACRVNAEYLIVTEIVELERQPALAAHIACNYQELKRNESFVIYRLERACPDRS